MTYTYDDIARHAMTYTDDDLARHAEHDAATRAQREASPPTPPAPTHGSLWWIANDHNELIESLIRLTAAGAVIESVSTVDPQKTDPYFNYTFRIERARAEEILSYAPDENEWLID